MAPINCLYYDTGHGNYLCTLLEIARKCSSCHRSWGWRPCHPSHAEISCSAANAEERLFHDSESCCQEPRKQVSVSLLYPICLASFQQPLNSIIPQHLQLYTQCTSLSFLKLNILSISLIHYYVNVGLTDASNAFY